MINKVSMIPSEQFNQDVSIILVTVDQLKKRSFAFSDKELKNALLDLYDSKLFKGDHGETFPVSLNKRSFLLVALGDKKDITSTSIKIIIKKALSCPNFKDATNIELVCHNKDESTIKNAIEGVLIGSYSWDKYKSKTEDKKKISQRNIYIVSPKNKVFDSHAIICESTNFTRDLVNDNADIVTSTFLEKTILSLIKDHKNVTVEILNKKELKAKGLNLLLGVNQGSNKEPKLIIVKYKGSTNKDKYTALVGKGITFDSGGLNLKPTGSIETMREDMGGAGAVIGALRNTLLLKLNKNIIFAVGIAENAIGSSAQKPGDVVVGYSKKSVEIANTDAEGRLVLADAISYIVKNYEPERLINIATLTGACVIALGYDYSGLISNDDILAKKLLKASSDTDDRAWHLPNYPELKDAVKSNIADIKNLGFPKSVAGALTAAEFLRQFVGETKWAHLDIAGTAFVEGTSRMYFGHGATGAGVRLLTNYLQNI
ncbi:MAG: leucyl aminopeptidase [Candidatus Omnitrophica bacterium]|nr:leucyl aminopeptidase [Candidatus Omnitrophota bacterium]MBU1996500.1 leucyl aminopeptidase [Candidatus Omnitrophota bacterium]